jgi:hypothetical protein
VDQIKTFIMWIVGIVFSIAIIFVGYSFFSKSMSIQNVADKSISDIQFSMNNSKFDMYDNKVVMGNDVINAIRLYSSGELQIGVTTNLKPKVIYTDPSQYTPNIADPAYIEPTAQFTSSIVKNQNGVVVAISFQQE